MKILHTSDLHLGISLCGTPLLTYQREMCGTLRRLSEQADAMIISGDVFDTSVASAEAMRLWSGFVTEMCLGRGIPVIVCAGNHDGAARLSSCAELLKNSGLYISGTIEDGFSPITVGDAAVYALPFFNPSDGAALLGCKPTAEDVMRTVAGRILENADPDKCNILAAHCFTAGGIVSGSDLSARASQSVGGADLIPADVFDGFDYAALGHLHKAQTIRVPGSGTIVRYSGAPLPYSFGDGTLEKTVTIFDTVSRAVTGIPVPQPYRLRTAEDEYEKILAAAENDPDREDFMKIVLTDRPGGDSAFMRLKELYPNLLSFSGTRPEAADGGAAAREAAELDIAALAVRYSEERRGQRPDEDEMRWLGEALSELEEEE